MKECTCIRYSLPKSVKDELVCHKSHLNGIPWLGLTCIMIGVERGGGRREKRYLLCKTLASYSTRSFSLFPFAFFLPLPLRSLHLPRKTCLDYRSGLPGLGFLSVNAQAPTWQIVSDESSARFRRIYCSSPCEISEAR